MTWNVLDWSAGPFLGLYVLLALASIAAAIAVKERLRRNASGPEPGGELSVLEAAVLAGGRARAADVLALDLVERGHVAIAADGQLSATGLNADAPPYLAPFRSSPCLNRRQVVEAMQPWIEPILDRLSTQGLALSQRHTFRMSAATFAIMAPVLVLGLVRVGLGQERERPVGYLITLVILTALATLLIAHVRRLGTGLGEEALLRLSKTRARAVRAPLPDELLLAVAVTGPVVLAGTAWAAYRAAFADGSGGGGCGGGGDGGGSGGGCGGCGGGH